MKFYWRNTEIYLKKHWNKPEMPKFARFAPLDREILHSLQILPWNFFVFAILARNLTQLQEKFYTICFCVIRCIAIFYPYPPRARSFYPEICPFFSEKKINLFPPRSCGILVVSKRVRVGPLPISPRKMSTFREKNLHFHREKCPRFPRNLTHSLYILNN